MLYNIILFIHILGTVIMFVAVGITLTAMLGMLHSKKIEALRNWAALAVKADGLLPFSVILILFPGLYLVISTWCWGIPWVELSLLTLIVMTFMGPTINLKRLKGILKSVNETEESVLSLQLLQRVRDRVLWNSVSIMTMLGIAILFMMTVKTDMIGSVITLIAAIVIGPIISKILLSKGNDLDSSNVKETTSIY